MRKLLIIGHGSVAIRHITNASTELSSDVQLAFLRNKKKKEFRYAQYFFDVRDALNWNPDAVIIASPSDTHVEYVRDFSDSHILVEKPAAMSLRDLDLIKEIIFRKDKVFQVGFNYRYHELLTKMRDKELLGKIKEISWYHSDYLPNWHTWEDYRESYAAKDGVALTLCHGLDLIYHVLGEYTCTAKSWDKKLPIPGNSTFEAELRFKNIPISYKVSMDTDEKKCYMKYLLNDGDYKYFDFYNLIYPRNESFRLELLDFVDKCKSPDKHIDSNIAEYDSMREMLSTWLK